MDSSIRKRIFWLLLLPLLHPLKGVFLGCCRSCGIVFFYDFFDRHQGPAAIIGAEDGAACGRRERKAPGELTVVRLLLALDGVLDGLDFGIHGEICNPVELVDFLIVVSRNKIMLLMLLLLLLLLLCCWNDHCLFLCESFHSVLCIYIYIMVRLISSFSGSRGLELGLI